VNVAYFAATIELLIIMLT